MSDFPQFALGIGKGLLQAATTDVDVFLLTCSGALLGSRSRRYRAAGGVLAGYVVARRADAYVDVIGTNLSRIGRVMADREMREAHPLREVEAEPHEGLFG